MQEQTETRAGLNGSGAGYTIAAEAEAAAAPAPVAGNGARLTHRARLRKLMAEPARYADIKRRVMETDESLGSMTRSLGVERTAFSAWVKAQGWPRPPTAPKPPQRRRPPARRPSDVDMAKARLVSAVSRQIELVEKRLDGPRAKVEEKDSRILGHLAKTLGTLMQMGSGGTTSNHAEPPDRGDVDERLAERIKRWARGEQGY